MNKIALFTCFFVVCFAYAQNEPYALGADISWLHERENPAAAGGGNVRYYHENTQQDMLAILKDHGFNYIRLRLFVDPTAGVPEDTAKAIADAKGGTPWFASPYSARGYCGLDSTIKYAKKVKAAGMKFLLDFHYSDTWADPGKQYKPMSWRNLTTLTQVSGKVRSYTKESLEKFRNNGVLPDMVQVGNEVVGGMVHPDGSGNTNNFAALVNAGINGVKDVDTNIKIMVHTISERNPNNWLTTLKTNLNKIEANAANKIDVLGLSYYPMWHGDLDSLGRILSAVSKNHNIKIAVVEYADKHREVNDLVFALPADKRFGTFVWEPQEFSGDNSLPLFDWKSGTNSGRHSNTRLELYPQMAIDYAIKTSSSSSSYPSSSSRSSSSSLSSSSSRQSSSSATLSSSSSGTTPIVLPIPVHSNAWSAMQNAVNLQTEKNTTIQVFDMKGNVIRTMTFTPGNYIIPFNDLPKGMYIVGASHIMPIRIVVR